jgi:hypothetical protein
LGKAAKIIAEACASEIPQPPLARVELVQKRLNAMPESTKAVRPAFETFYRLLTAEKEARLMWPVRDAGAGAIGGGCAGCSVYLS